MSIARSDYVSRVIELYLGAPDTPDLPRDNDWPIAGVMYDAGIPVKVVELAFHFAFLLATSSTWSATVTHRRFAPWPTSLTPGERDPGYMAYIASSYAAKRDDPEGFLQRFTEDATRLCKKMSNRP